MSGTKSWRGAVLICALVSGCSASNPETFNFGPGETGDPVANETATGSGSSTAAQTSTTAPQTSSGSSSGSSGSSSSSTAQTGSTSGTTESNTGGASTGSASDRMPVVLYTFAEGSGLNVGDSSGAGAPLDLTIADAGAVTWNGNGSLTVSGDTIIQAAGAGTKISSACIAADQLSVEAWLTPANLTDSGPARIVTLSNGTSNRNFTLGQEGDDYVVRLRTNSGGNTNGTSPDFVAANVLTTSLTHVVFTRGSDGTATMYLDGVPTSLSADSNTGTFASWDPSFGFALADELAGTARHWHGDYHHVALFDVALTPTEVSARFAAGPD